VVRAGDLLSIHGQTGELYVGSLPLLGIVPEAETDTHPADDPQPA
jgi:hypothetical protein